MTDLRRPAVLDSTHDRSQFDCGNTSLNDYLARFATQHRRQHTATTWVIADTDNRVAAYATLSASGIRRAQAPPALAKSAPDPIPALLIGRLATDTAHQGLGVGTALVKHILATALELDMNAGFKAVIVNALTPQARTWWESLGFTPYQADDPDNLDLYLLTKTIAATLAALDT